MKLLELSAMQLAEYSKLQHETGLRGEPLQRAWLAMQDIPMQKPPSITYNPNIITEVQLMASGIATHQINLFAQRHRGERHVTMDQLMSIYRRFGCIGKRWPGRHFAKQFVQAVQDQLDQDTNVAEDDES